jgi:hypothetical protein
VRVDLERDAALARRGGLVRARERRRGVLLVAVERLRLGLLLVRRLVAQPAGEPLDGRVDLLLLAVVHALEVVELAPQVHGAAERAAALHGGGLLVDVARSLLRDTGRDRRALALVDGRRPLARQREELVADPVLRGVVVGGAARGSRGRSPPRPSAPPPRAAPG